MTTRTEMNQNEFVEKYEIRLKIKHEEHNFTKHGHTQYHVVLKSKLFPGKFKTTFTSHPMYNGSPKASDVILALSNDLSCIENV